MASDWQAAFQAIQSERHFLPLNDLLELGRSGPAAGINEMIEWDGALLTPLFVAVLLRLEDHLAQFILSGADPGVCCMYDGLLCGPVHAAALLGDVTVLRALLEAGAPADAKEAETSVLDDTAPPAGAVESGAAAPLAGVSFVGCNALHLLIIRDSFSEEVYRLLLEYGAKLSAFCRTRAGSELSALALPRQLWNKTATEERLDSVVHLEMMHTIRTPGLANTLNNFLELGDVLKRKQADVAYRFVRDLNFAFGFPFATGEDATESMNALLYAADVGNSEALRLLLYAGADASHTLLRPVSYRPGRTMTLRTSLLHLAALRADIAMIEQLLIFGMEPMSLPCCGTLHVAGDSAAVEEQWSNLSLVHLAVLAGKSDFLPALVNCNCNLDTPAERKFTSDGRKEVVSPLLLAVLKEDVLSTSQLLSLGATVSDTLKEAALERKVVSEMFGGPPVVGLDDWLEALLTGETSLQALVDRRTDLSRVLEWPKDSGASSVVAVLERHRLSSPDLVGRLVQGFEAAPTVFDFIRPVHLACLLQQPWAIEMLVDNGAAVSKSTPCMEMAASQAVLATGTDGDHSAALALRQQLEKATLEGEDGPKLTCIPLDLVLLCVRFGCLQVLELLVREPRYAMNVQSEIGLCPDITPAFFPWKAAPVDEGTVLWAWCRLGGLELALLHRRLDMAVLLVRLGADMLHTVDHIAIRPPDHYSVTDHCFRGLTPLHLCALLDNRVAAAALLNEACVDSVPVHAAEHPRPQRQALLSAVSVQAWATVDTNDFPHKEPWLWRDLTPLHLAIISKSYDTAELLIEASSAATLGKLCLFQDVAGDTQRSFSALLLAFEKGLKDLHRKIAKKFPSC